MKLLLTLLLPAAILFLAGAGTDEAALREKAASMAAEAKINYNTVTKAYRDLELSGLAVSARGRGMFVQRNISLEESEEDAIDALLENCIRQYRSKGMTYREVRGHMLSIIDELERKAREAEEEKSEYGIVQ